METTIVVNIEDYMTKEEIKEIIHQEIRYGVKKSLEHEYGISNTSYYLVASCVDQLLDKEDKKNILENTKKIISEMTSFSVFKEKDNWRQKDSLAQTYVNEAVESNKDLIKKKVDEIIIERIENISKSYMFNEGIKEEIENGVYEAIVGKLFNEKEQ